MIFKTFCNLKLEILKFYNNAISFPFIRPTRKPKHVSEKLTIKVNDNALHLFLHKLVLKRKPV